MPVWRWGGAAGGGPEGGESHRAEAVTLEARPRTSAPTPPQELDAEASVLGAIMVSQEGMTRVADILRPEFFYAPRHRQIYSAAVELYRRSEPIDILTLSAELRRAGSLDVSGGTDYLAELERGIGIPAHVENYARLVEGAAMRRGMLEAARHITELGHDMGRDIDEALELAEEHIFELANQRSTDTAVALRETLQDYWTQLERLHDDPGAARGLRSGFHDLDAKTAGFQPGGLVIIAARPMVGKTSLALNVAQHVALEEKVPVAIFSLEMSRWELTQRFLAGEAGIDSYQLRTGKLADSDWAKITSAWGRLTEGVIMIDDRPSITPLDIRAKSRRMKSAHGIGLVIIDYLQLMTGSGRSENRQQEVTEISRSLKAMARELDIPVIAISQLSRAPEQRADRKPQLSDLRESGSLEQDADLVLFLYREGLHDSSIPRSQTELIIAKHRSGPTGTVNLLFHEARTRFVSTTRPSQTPPPGAARPRLAPELAEPGVAPPVATDGDEV